MKSAFLLSILLVASLLILARAAIHPEAELPFLEYCRHFGYPAQAHYITTEDGYILGFFRIQARNTNIRSGLPPIYLQHGLLDSSDTWIVNDKEAPGLILADKGYDVWLGNSRGNKHSRNHTTLNPDTDAAFWDFSFQHMADFDLPAAFRYISGVTGSKVHYIGHSQGTIQMHIALAKNNPVVETLIGKYFGFGPVAYVKHQQSHLLTLMDKYGVADFFKIRHIKEFLPSPKWFETETGRIFCSEFEHVCTDMLKYIADADPNLDNYERMDVLVGHDPSGTSCVNMYHWVQILNSGRFQAYDWGSAALNVQHYGQSTPPVWNLNNIRVPIRLFAGSSDMLATQLDIEHMWSELNKDVKTFYKEYVAGHVTFLIGKTVQPWMTDVLRFLSE